MVPLQTHRVLTKYNMVNLAEKWAYQQKLLIIRQAVILAYLVGSVSISALLVQPINHNLTAIYIVSLIRRTCTV